MANFKVGDRVRIIGPSWGSYFGKTGTIWGVGPCNWATRGRLAGYTQGSIGYRVDVDGVGRKHNSGFSIAYESHHLVPLTPSHEEAWQAFKRLHLTPKPSLILAKELTTTEEPMKWWPT